jgi:DNA-binding LacI/PurR family transcriptional regulator
MTDDTETPALVAAAAVPPTAELDPLAAERSESNVGARVGMRDVARAAGVSTQTVSRVLNGHPYIREETRDKVLEAMTSLGYRVNNAARALGTQRTKTIGVIAADATLYGPSVAIAAVEAAARAEGRWIATTYADADDEESVLAAFEHLRAQGVDGVIVIGAHSRIREAIDQRVDGFPVAVLHGDHGSLAQRRAAATIVGYLTTLGHRRIARIGGPADWLEEAARSAGFDDALTGGAVCSVRLNGDWSAASGAAAGERLARLIGTADGPTAIVAANDQMALGAIAALTGRGHRVPEDVSVAGFDDGPDSAFYRPSLTTVRVDITAEAKRCVAAITAPTRPAEAAAAGVAAPLLVVRESTAPPAR